MAKTLIIDKETGQSRWVNPDGADSLPCGQGFKRYEYDECAERGRLTEDPTALCGETRSEKTDITDKP